MMGPFVLVLVLTTRSVAASDPESLECRKMGDIYADGKDLCEKMWGESFIYEDDESKGYTFWFGDNNPNSDVSAALFTDAHADLDVCYLEYNHKATPGNESLDECKPWSSHGCCAPATVKDAQTLKEAQGGPEYHWDRCRTLSADCERYFIEEACFYECEPAVGLFRKYPSEALLHGRDGHEVHDPRCDSDSDVYDKTFADANCNNGHNSWEIHQMPIKASYCNAFYEACKNDLFCGKGDFFECAKVDPNADSNKLTTLENRQKYLDDLKQTVDVLPDESLAFQLGLAALLSFV
jgi:folate receptor